jgi:hypothetical protein
MRAWNLGNKICGPLFQDVEACLLRSGMFVPKSPFFVVLFFFFFFFFVFEHQEFVESSPHQSLHTMSQITFFNVCCFALCFVEIRSLG